MYYLKRLIAEELKGQKVEILPFVVNYFYHGDNQDMSDNITRDVIQQTEHVKYFGEVVIGCRTPDDGSSLKMKNWKNQDYVVHRTNLINKLIFNEMALKMVNPRSDYSVSFQGYKIILL